MSSNVDVVVYASQARLIDELLTRPKPPWWRLERWWWRPQACTSSELCSPDAYDAEFGKNLQIFRQLVGAAERLHRRAYGTAAPTTDDGQPIQAFKERVAEVSQQITLPTDLPLTLELLLARRFELEQLLIELGDRDYLSWRLAEVYDERPGTISTWRSLYGDELPALLPGAVTRNPEAANSVDEKHEVEATRARLARLMGVKAAEDHVVKARWKLKHRAAMPTILVLFLVLVAFAVASARMVAGDRALWAAVAAGGTGAALGGLIRLRDEITLGTQARQFWSFFLGQVLVGVAAGLITFLVDDGGLIVISGGSSGVAAVAAAVGFSEAAFVGLLGRLGGSVAAG